MKINLVIKICIEIILNERKIWWRLCIKTFAIFIILINFKNHCEDYYIIYYLYDICILIKYKYY